MLRKSPAKSIPLVKFIQFILTARTWQEEFALCYVYGLIK